MTRPRCGALLFAAAVSCGLASYPRALVDAASATVTLSIVSTTDLHGVIAPPAPQGGLALFGGYLKALRAARAQDQGAVVLLDAGDIFQGGIESDLSEGAIVVDAYNALGYTAAAIGNHEFDFGRVDRPGAQEGSGDRHGTVKARAAQAHFPFLAANLIDDATGRLVDWPNVRPSVLIEAAGIKVGIVGVMTAVALRATLPANAGPLHVAPLAPAIVAQATKLREDGADVVVVVSHAGGRCTTFDAPDDLSSCDQDAEIFQVARALPRGLVDVIAAGHSHEAVAHRVDGIAIVQAFPRGQAFARTDLVVDRQSKRIKDTRLFPPRLICAHDGEVLPGCLPLPGQGWGQAVEYEGRPVVPDAAIVEAMAPALARVRALQATPIGLVLDAPLLRDSGVDSPLGNIFADALRESSPGADVAITNTRMGGLRADLPAGPLTFGRLYDVFPFDNRTVRLTMTGNDLTRILIDEVNRRRPGALAISGLTVHVACPAGNVAVTLSRPSGRQVAADESLTIATVDLLAGGAVFASVRPPGPLAVSDEAPLLREVVERWFRRHAERHQRLTAVDATPRWIYPPQLLEDCRVP